MATEDAVQVACPLTGLAEAEAEATAVDLVLDALVLVALEEEEVDSVVMDELLDLLFVGLGLGAEVEFLVEEDECSC